MLETAAQANHHCLTPSPFVDVSVEIKGLNKKYGHPWNKEVSRFVMRSTRAASKAWLSSGEAVEALRGWVLASKHSNAQSSDEVCVITLNVRRGWGQAQKLDAISKTKFKPKGLPHSTRQFRGDALNWKIERCTKQALGVGEASDAGKTSIPRDCRAAQRGQVHAV